MPGRPAWALNISSAFLAGTLTNLPRCLSRHLSRVDPGEGAGKLLDQRLAEDVDPLGA